MAAGELPYSTTSVLWAPRVSRVNQMVKTVASRGEPRGKRTFIPIVSAEVIYTALHIGWLSDMIDQLRYDPS